MFYVYVLRSKLDGKLYIGFTKNLRKRLHEHSRGLVTSTKNRRPFKLIYCEASNIMGDAIVREKALKTGFGRAYLKRRISE